MPDPGDPTSDRARDPDPDSDRDRGTGDGDGPDERQPQPASRADVLAQLSHLRAAQLRTRTVRGGIVKVAFGTVFLVGALAHALSPERHEQSSVFWMTLLALLSTVNVALGLRSVARARPRPAGFWLPVACAWGALAVILLGLLLRR